MILQQGFPQFDQPFVDVNTGRILQPWMQLLITLWNRTGQAPGASITNIEVLTTLSNISLGEEGGGGGDASDPFLSVLLSGLGLPPEASPVSFTAQVLTSEDLAAYDFVNVYSSSGAKVRKADATDPAKFAQGWVFYPAPNATLATVLFGGVNPITAGSAADEVYLSETVPGSFQTGVPTTAGHILQTLGPAIPGKGVAFAYSTPVTLT